MGLGREVSQGRVLLVPETVLEDSGFRWTSFFLLSCHFDCYQCCAKNAKKGFFHFYFYIFVF